MCMLAEDARNLASTREDSQGVNVLTDLGGGLDAYLEKTIGVPDQFVGPLYGLVLAPSGTLQACLEVFRAVC